MTKSRTARNKKWWYILPAIALAGALILIIAPFCLSFAARAVLIKIPQNATEATLRDTLNKYFEPAFAAHTLQAFKALGRTPAERYGAYELKEGATPAGAARILSRGAQSPMRFTVNGVRQLDSFIPLVAAKFAFSEDELRKALEDSATLAKYELTKEQVPDLFLNDTYYVYWTSTPQQLIGKLGENYNRLWDKENREKAAAIGLSPAEIMTIASIVDEETAAQSEKGRIGRLYINRLKKGMKLQADPTVKFALGDFTIKRITGEHLKAAGPYNTYRVSGLPPGPIRTTSKATVEAILNAPESNDLYMCAKEDFSGTHNFASDYAEHLENARRYQQALDERNIR